MGKVCARKSAKHLGYVRRWQYLCNVVSSAVVHKVRLSREKAPHTPSSLSYSETFDCNNLINTSYLLL